MPFVKRNGGQFVILKNRVYMIHNDVWSSAEGINWILETKELVKGETINGSAVIVFMSRYGFGVATGRAGLKVRYR